MKKFIKQRIINFRATRTFKAIYKLVIRINGLKLDYTRAKSPAEEKMARIISSLKVLNGPFEGMQYPDFESYGSASWPKLLGTYESELTRVILAKKDTDYSSIVDIGCAEGYYAVGLGKMFQTKVYAFDTNKEALRACATMAQINDVEILFGDFCNSDILTGLELGNRALIVIDCEGYEKQLISPEVTRKLRNHDFIIECHDFIDIDITAQMINSFSETHQTEIIESIDDIQKAYRYDMPELSGFSIADKLQFVKEGRPTIMTWVIATTKANIVQA